MLRKFTLAVSMLLLCAAPAWAGTLQIYEDSLGSPGVTAPFPTGTGLVADIDMDSDSAEGGGLLLGGPSEISITPTGSLIFVAFACQLTGCTEGLDYVFTPGGAGTGSLLLSDPDFDAHSGIYELGDITFNAASFGTIQLNGCNYTDGNGTEQTCNPFTLVAVPEPMSGALLGFALIGLGFVRRTRR